MLMICHRRACYRLLLPPLVCLLAAFLPRSAFAMALSPGLALVQHVPLGKEIPLSINCTVINKTDEDRSFTLELNRPGGVWGKDWEAGYEAWPDLNWCRLEKSAIEVKAQSEQKVEIFVTIPDKPEYYNRKWVVMVYCRATTPNEIGAGLAIASRVMLETAPNEKLDGVDQGQLAIVPAIMNITGEAGEKGSVAVKIRNNSGLRLGCQCERLVNVYQKDYKYARYTSPGFTALVKESWTTPAKDMFALESEALSDLTVNVEIPADAQPGKYEELVFVRGNGPVNGDEGTPGVTCMNFLRVRYEVTAPAKPPDKPDGAGH
jgi:hypothetical protein